MKVRMSDNEKLLFESFVNSSQRYLEFGAGGSTCFAAAKPKEWLITIDSSAEYLEMIARATATSPTRPETVFIDIGRVGDFGSPADPSTKARWPNYHEDIWARPESSNADLYLVDGRFRVACALQCLLRGKPGTPIMVHDFASRPHYQVLKSFAREIAVTEDLSVFVRADNFEIAPAIRTLKEYRFNYA